MDRIYSLVVRYGNIDIFGPINHVTDKDVGDLVWAINQTRNRSREDFEKLDAVVSKYGSTESFERFMNSGQEEEGQGSRFEELLGEVMPLIPSELKKNLVLSRLSSDMLSESRIGAFLAESVYSDMSFAILRSQGAFVEEDKMKLWFRAMAVTSPLARATHNLLSRRLLSSHDDQTVIKGLFSLVSRSIQGKFGYGERNLRSIETYKIGDVAKFSLLIEEMMDKIKD